MGKWAGLPSSLLIRILVAPDIDRIEAAATTCNERRIATDKVTME
jgi:hypothetical protein